MNFKKTMKPRMAMMVVVEKYAAAAMMIRTGIFNFYRVRFRFSITRSYLIYLINYCNEK